MAGLYIHIPFCKSKCHYCDFVSFAGREYLMEAYTDRLIKEMRSFKGRLFDTVYLGGGTPSCLPAKLAGRLFDAIHACFSIAPDAEMTCEMNPDSVTREYLQCVRQAGFNRISLGMQSHDDRLLRALGRVHSASDTSRSAALCRNEGFININLDLMFGIPGQTVHDVVQAIETAAALGAAHISCYSLSVEEGTPFHADISGGLLTLPDEDTERDMYDQAVQALGALGFKPYEISNFAQAGCACRHNIGYWRQKPYLGVGLAAHSYENAARTANTAVLEDYLQGVTVVSREIINAAESRFETLMLGLRMTDGVPLDVFLKMHGVTLEDVYGKKIKLLAEKGLLILADGALKLTRRGMEVQNAVLTELM